jgi:hypothetical protein
VHDILARGLWYINEVSDVRKRYSGFLIERYNSSLSANVDLKAPLLSHLIV